MTNPTGMKVVACIHPDTLSMMQSDSHSARVACERWTEVREMDGYVPLVTLADAEAAISEKDEAIARLIEISTRASQKIEHAEGQMSGFTVRLRAEIDALSKLGEKGNG